MFEDDDSIFDELRWWMWLVAVVSVSLVVWRLIKKRIDQMRMQAEHGGRYESQGEHRELNLSEVPTAAPTSTFPPPLTTHMQQTGEPARMRGEVLEDAGVDMEIAPLVGGEEVREEVEERAEGMISEGSPPVAGEGDDLKVIEGIGPVTEERLRQAGIHTFQQLADTSVDRLQEIVREANLNLARPETWPEQAQLAAQGRWDELDRLMEDIKGGRKTDE